MKTSFEVKISPALANELLEAARACDLPPEFYAAQAIENALAERRIQRHDAERLRSHPSLPCDK